MRTGTSRHDGGDAVLSQDSLELARVRVPSSRVSGPGSVPAGTSPFTPADLQVLQLLPQPLSHAEIAARLGSSPGAVRTRAVSIYRVLGAVSRGDAVRRARELGLV
jgi:DNA-binding NarL/FixJ family response regulator